MLTYYLFAFQLFPLTFFHSRLPFNWKTPIGYSAVVLFLSIATFVLLSTIVPSLCLTIGSSVLVRFFIRLFTREVIGMQRLPRKQRTKIKERIRVFIQKFADTKELSLDVLRRDHYSLFKRSKNPALIPSETTTNRNQTTYFLCAFRFVFAA